MTISDREEPMNLRELEKAATPGPWEVGTAGMDAIVKRHNGSYMTIGDSWYHPDNVADATLIAALRNAAPFLLDVEQKARTLMAGEPFDYHGADAAWNDLKEALSALDSHLSAASERETPE